MNRKCVRDYHVRIGKRRTICLDTYVQYFLQCFDFKSGTICIFDSYYLYFNSLWISINPTLLSMCIGKRRTICLDTYVQYILGDRYFPRRSFPCGFFWRIMNGLLNFPTSNYTPFQCEDKLRATVLCILRFAFLLCSIPYSKKNYQEK